MRFNPPSIGIALLATAFIGHTFAQGVLEEIIVTAQKREQNIQEVPLSITNLSGDRLNARFTGGEDILSLSSAAPGLHVESSNGRLAPRFYLRGLGNADFTQAASQPVSIVFDEVPMEKAALKAFPLFDMADIEVIRGPQGTLFGRNTTAGIIKIDSRRPTEETEGFARLAVGNLGTVNAEAAIGGTLVEQVLTGRASFMTQNRADWVSNGFTGEADALGGHNVFAGRLQLLWTPRDDVTAWVMHQHQDADGTASLFRANVLSTGSNELNDNYDRDTVFFDGGDNNPGKIKSHGTTVKLDWDINRHTITSITAYQDVYDRFGRSDIDGGNPRGPGRIPFPVDTGSSLELTQFTQEVRLASQLDGAFNYQVGLFYFEDDLAINSQGVRQEEFQTNSTSNIENTTWAVFGQGSYAVNEQLTLTAGVRYTDDEKDALHVDFNPPIIPSVPIALSDDNISWDLALSYAMTDEAQVYARIASGFRAPTIQDRIEDDVNITTADSETIMSYEVGYKADINQRLRLNTALFYYDIDDMQLTAIGGTANTTSLLNAKGGEGYGLEFDIDWIATDNLIVSGGFGYARTKIKDEILSVSQCSSCTITDPLNDNNRALINGNPFQHAPLWTANIELDYRHPLSGDGELYLFTDWKFKGETNDFLYESIEYITDTQFEGGLRAGYRNVTHNYEIGFFIRNITDEDNLIGGIDFNNNTGYVNEPRVWGVEAAYRF